MLDSEPLENINHCKTLRFLSKFSITLPYNKNNSNKSTTTYKSNIEVGVINFIKAYYSKNETLGLRGDELKYVKVIIAFINGAKPAKAVKISLTSVAQLKRLKLIWKPEVCGGLFIVIYIYL